MEKKRKDLVGFNDQDLSEELKKLTKKLGELDTTLTGTLKEMVE